MRLSYWHSKTARSSFSNETTPSPAGLISWSMCRKRRQAMGKLCSCQVPQPFTKFKALQDVFVHSKGNVTWGCRQRVLLQQKCVWPSLAQRYPHASKRCLCLYPLLYRGKHKAAPRWLQQLFEIVLSVSLARGQVNLKQTFPRYRSGIQCLNWDPYACVQTGNWTVTCRFAPRKKNSSIRCRFPSESTTDAS